MTPRIQFDFSAIDPRYRALIIGGVVIIVLAIVSLILFASKDPKPEVGAVATPTLSPSSSPLASPSPAGPPTNPPTIAPTATLQPYEWTVQAGETLGFIIQQFGYRDFSVIPGILALNNLPNENAITEGQILLIPRQTPTPGPTFTPTPTHNPLVTPGTPTATSTPAPTIEPGVTQDFSECSPENRCPSLDGQYWLHTVQAGDTVSSIARAYNSNVGCIREANGFVVADPLLTLGQQVNVCILVTLTPTLTPTGGPDATATATPLPHPPALLAPAKNAAIERGADVVLQWAAVRPLAQGQWYLILVRNHETGEEFKGTTRSNTYRVAATQFQPGTYDWQVAVIGSNSVNAPVISLPGEMRTFAWGR